MSTTRFGRGEGTQEGIVTTSYRASLQQLPGALTFSTVSTGLVTFIMVLTIPFPVVYQAATEAGWTAGQIGSWFFAVLATGALMQLVLTLGYRQPLAAGVSTVATAFLVRALPTVTVEEAVGAYVLCGALFVVLGVTGVFGRYLDAIPQAVVMGMLAGALLRFETDIFQEVVKAPAVVGPAVVAWLVASRLRSRFVPPVAAALIVGVVSALAGGLGAGSVIPIGLTLPELYQPRFTLTAFLSLTIPLLLLVASQNASAIGALWTHGYRPPANAVTVSTGLFSILAGLMGAQGVSLGAQRSAVAADPSVHPLSEMRYSAMVVDAGCVLASAAVATTMVGLFTVLPVGVVRVVAGLAMLPVVVQALAHAVGEGRFRFGGFAALVIAASNVSVLGVSSVFWALVLAPPLSVILDRKPADQR